VLHRPSIDVELGAGLTSRPQDLTRGAGPTWRTQFVAVNPDAADKAKDEDGRRDVH